MPDPEAISLSIAQAIAASAAASLEETRASRKEVYEALRAQGKSIGDLRDDLRELRRDILPPLASHARYVDGLEEKNVEALGESATASLRAKTAFTDAMTSKAAIALWTALGTALAGALASYLGAI